MSNRRVRELSGSCCPAEAGRTGLKLRLSILPEFAHRQLACNFFFEINGHLDYEWG